MIRFLALPLLLACIWDTDTIDDELRGVPDGLTLVTGRWFRHSPAYYTKRLNELPARLESNPEDLEAYDDLAVAYERLGDRPKAIEVMSRKFQALGRRPSKEHLYRYHANLGTFLAHSGRLAEGRAEIEKALAINPEAHFGREHFQVDLLSYMIAVKDRPELWKEHDALSFAGYAFTDRSGHQVVEDSHSTPTAGTRPVEWKEAYTAIGAILRYGGVESPELYRILGDLFLVHGDLNLAWWSFQHAIEKKHPASALLGDAVRRIEWHWQHAGYRQVPTLDLYRKVRQEADSWAGAFDDLETEWTRKEEMARLAEPLPDLLREADRRVPIRVRPPTPALGAAFPAAMGLSLSVLGAGVGSAVWVTVRRRRHARNGRDPRRRIG
jgi:tetratricopeptide (TPR) repeat protein